MISIYSSAFNLINNNFDYLFIIDNFCNISDEVVIAVNTSIDSTYEILSKLCSKYKNLKIIDTNFSYDDPLLDGKIKNEALQSSTMPIKIGLDMDEYIPIWQKNIWISLSNQLLKDDCLCYMVPSINLYKNCEYYFSITPKWYIHKSGLFRGPVNFAKKQNGFIDTSKSDTCELIDSYGDLVYSKMCPSNIELLREEKYPFVVHMGYLSLENRIIRNNNFWNNHWKVESGGYDPAHKVHKTLDDFDESSSPHKLRI